MELCSINPKGTWQWMYERPTVMLLTHLVEKYPEYVQFAKDHPNTYKILDNSLIELGGALSMDRLVKAAETINANEIILTDEFTDGEKTIKKVKESIQWLKDRNLIGKYKLMAVCHGKNFEEWKNCFDQLNAMPEVDVIGIPKVTATWTPNHTRNDLKNIFSSTTKELHLLGSWYNLDELLTLDKDVVTKIRSADTCLPSLYVIQNKHVWENRDGTINLEKEYSELTKEKYDRVLNEFDLLYRYMYKKEN